MKYFVYVFTFFLLVSCGSQTTVPQENVTHQNKEEVAVIYGQGGGASGFFKSILLPIGTQKDISITKLNGSPIENKGTSTKREYWITEGKHTFSIKCTLQVGGTSLIGKKEVIATVLKGQKYILDAKPGKGPHPFLNYEVDACVPFITAVPKS